MELVTSLHTLRDQKHFSSFKDAFDEIRRTQNNNIDLGHGISLKYDLKLRGFVAYNSLTNTSKLICPVFECDSYTGGGHQCIHGTKFIKSIKEKNEKSVRESLLQNQITPTRIRLIIEKMLVDRNLSMQYMKEEYSTALQSLKKSLECNPWKSKEFGVKSVVIKFGSFEITLLNGTTYITCAHPFCYEKGLMNPVKTKGVYFRCEKHCLTLKHPEYPTSKKLEAVRKLRKQLLQVSKKLTANKQTIAETVKILQTIKTKQVTINQFRFRVTDTFVLEIENINTGKSTPMCAVLTCGNLHNEKTPFCKIHHSKKDVEKILFELRKKDNGDK